MTNGIRQTTLRPGWLVACSTSVTGNTKYSKIDIEKATVSEDGAEKSRWETQRTVQDKAEQDAASKLRSECRGTVAKICTPTAFGLLCPKDRKEELDAVVAEARSLCEAFNRTSKVTTIKFSVIAGEIAPDDKEAINAINREVRTLVAEMEDSLKVRDYAGARKAADQLKSLAGMLTADAQVRIQFALDATRAKARELAKAEKDTGTVQGVTIDQRTLTTLAETSAAFVDLTPAAAVAAPEDQGAVVDLSPAKPADAPKDEAEAA